MEEKLFIPIILGTNRDGRQSELVARWVMAEMEKRDDVETQLIDIRDFTLPEDGYGEYIKDQFTEYKETIERADGIVIVSPEYNHSFSGKLKSVLDILYGEYNRKAVGIVSVSMGQWGGVRMTESIASVSLALGLVQIKESLQFTSVPNVFDEGGSMKEEFVEGYEKRFNGFFNSLVWMGASLRWGRKNIE